MPRILLVDDDVELTAMLADYLAAEGFVVFEGQKGFSVPPVTRAHLLDITRSRQFVEPEALRQAMEAGDAAWEDGIVASLSLLGREVARRTAEPAWLDAYEAKHHRFHHALIAACGSTIA